jgi:hypothetical protein
VSAKPDPIVRSIQAGLLSWLVPGAGHFLLGQRGLGLVCFIAITFVYFTGLAFGGVKDSVNPITNRWLFLAELGVGGYTLPSWVACRTVEQHLASAQQRGEAIDIAPYSSYYPEADVATIYLATAGLLNLLVILDSISRAQTGRPTFPPAADASTPAGPRASAGEIP